MEENVPLLVYCTFT